MPTSPTSSHGGGKFNGGTITTPLVVAPAVDPGNNQSLFEVDDPATNAAIHVVSDGLGGIKIVHLETADQNFQLGKGSSPAQLNAVGIVFGNMNAAQADGNVSTSDFSLWLDDTPGATKLMVKAKDSGGTVRAAAIALS